MDERIRASEVAKLTSLHVRTVQLMAAKGEIPGAAKLGGTWTFNLKKLSDWIDQKERQLACHASSGTSSRGVVPGGVASKSPDIAIEHRYEQLIRPKPKSGSKRGAKSSNARHAALSKTIPLRKPSSDGSKPFYLVQ